ncbi:unnamed protein product [Caenorhabditis auriculariae]|uniref:CHCH domain-containing protein n=1 Tax=Caenorhabditis auriculariae TaxID=2777116 RepID=A0A8S1HTA5_9PELO|nr:unnamed protein product [Caenorhabditis auriculariae]
MVRRRSASPQASAPVRSAPRPAPRPAAAAAPPQPASSHAPPPQMAQSPMMPPPGAAPSRGPGLMGQMAATAGGVAIGSAVGHAVGNMFTGGSGTREEAPALQTATVPQQQQFSQPCEFEWKQFIDCSQMQSDVSLCNGFNEAFKQCKARYN